MGRSLLALAVVVSAILRSDLYHSSPLYSLWLPLLGLAAFFYLAVRLLARGARRRSSGDGGSSGDSWSGCDSDGCGGGDGGGD